MPRYADPTLCPDCGATLPPDPVSCPRCALPLRGPDATSLFVTLQGADAILARLRAAAEPVPAPATPPSGGTTGGTTGGPVSGPWVPEPYPVTAPASDRRPRRGLSAASVPKILLGLGALCLLVAAVTFLAVAWSWLGVGGRTAVLVALTLLTGGLGTWLGRRGLRVAAESLTVVALGLLALDVVGADNAGWLGDLDVWGTACAVGAALLAVSVGLMLASTRLVAPQVVAALGLWTLLSGASGLTDHDQPVAAAGVLAFAALAALGRFGPARLRSTVVLPWVALAGGVTWWLALVLGGLADAADHASLRELWLDGHGFGLLAASLLLLVPVAFDPSRTQVVLGCGAACATLASVTLALPGLDDGLTTLTLVSLAFVAVWASATVVVPTRWALIPQAPLGLATMPVLAVAVGLVVQAAERVVDIGDPFTRDAGVRLAAADAAAHPAVLVPSVLGLLVTAAVLVPGASLERARTLWPAPAGVLALAGIATLALTPAPLWTVVAALALGGAALVAVSLRRTDLLGTGLGVAGSLLAALGAASALPSDVLTTGAVAVLVLAAAGMLVAGRFPGADLLGGALLPVSLAGLIWSAGEMAGVDQAHRAVPVLVVVGLLAVLRPRVAIETSAALAAVVTTLAAIAAATDRPGSVALHLTIAGALVSASALVTPSRRPLGWLGGLLLAAATWVRLADLGVEAPEAYTLPTAVALLLVGLHRLHRDREASTVLALAPGLTLATTPSLLWVLDDPVSLRAALLGAACLALVLAGTRLRWNAPLVIGSVVGGLLVLRELAPYAAATPQWVLIGLAGTMLTVVGVTWERRMQDVRLAATYLGRLR